MRRLYTILTLSILLIGFNAESNGQVMDLTTVKELDLNRYMGKWYEIARFPHFLKKALWG
jgi:lipocalin